MDDGFTWFWANRFKGQSSPRRCISLISLSWFTIQHHNGFNIPALFIVLIVSALPCTYSHITMFVRVWNSHDLLLQKGHDSWSTHTTGEQAYYNYGDPPLNNCAISVANKTGLQILQAIQARWHLLLAFLFTRGAWASNAHQMNILVSLNAKLSTY